jgi:hypothetical protein
MDWLHAFPESLVLSDGRTLHTLKEAGDLLMGLPALHQRNGHWMHAMELLMAAAEEPSSETIERTASQMNRALRAEGLIVSAR